MLRKLYWLPVISLSLAPIMASAASCQSVMNNINADINQYGDTLKDQSLPWMKLSWLTQTLGEVAKKETTDTGTTYEWRCESDAGYLIANADATGKLQTLRGQYSSDTGSGLFSANIPEQPMEVVNQPTVAAASPAIPAPLFITAPEQNDDSPCKQAIKQIHGDIAAFGNTLQDQRLPWMTFSQIQKVLGQTSSYPVYEYLYKWDQYSLLIDVDGTKTTLGSLPNDSKADSLEELTKTLGHPKRTMMEKLNQYTWHCPEINGSNISVVTTKDNLITYVSGKDCDNNECTPFNAKPDNSALARDFNLQVRAEAARSVEALNKRLKNYNEFYKTRFERQDELATDISFKIQNYYTAIRQCKPGVYHYPLPVSQGFIFNTSVIQSDKKDGRCQVETSYDISHIGTVTLKCNYRPASLEMFSVAEAAKAANGNTTFNTENPSAMQQLTDSECKRYINGVL